MFEPAELLRDRVGYMHLVEVVDPDSVAANDMSRNADGGTVGRNLIENHRARGYIRVVADFERAEHLCARADHDIVADSRMAFAGILAGTAEGHALIYHNIVADNGGLADNDAGAVIDEKRLPMVAAGCISIPVLRAARCDIQRARKNILRR